MPELLSTSGQPVLPDSCGLKILDTLNQGRDRVYTVVSDNQEYVLKVVSSDRIRTSNPLEVAIPCLIGSENIVNIEYLFERRKICCMDGMSILEEKYQTTLYNWVQDAIKKANTRDRVRADALPRLTYQLLATTKSIHDAGFLHLDIKPENVAISNGIIKMIDFGSAKKMTFSDGAVSDHVSFTVPYASPELLAQHSNPEVIVTWKDDAWSLALLIIYLWTGGNIMFRTSVVLSDVKSVLNHVKRLSGDPIARKNLIEELFSNRSIYVEHKVFGSDLKNIMEIVFNLTGPDYQRHTLEECIQRMSRGTFSASSVKFYFPNRHAISASKAQAFLNFYFQVIGEYRLYWPAPKIMPNQAIRSTSEDAFGRTTIGLIFLVMDLCYRTAEIMIANGYDENIYRIACMIIAMSCHVDDQAQKITQFRHSILSAMYTNPQDFEKVNFLLDGTIDRIFFITSGNLYPNYIYRHDLPGRFLSQYLEQYVKNPLQYHTFQGAEVNLDVVVRPHDHDIIRFGNQLLSTR